MHNKGMLFIDVKIVIGISRIFANVKTMRSPTSLEKCQSSRKCCAKAFRLLVMKPS